MNMLKRYENMEKLMPWNTKKMVLNLKPYVKFEGDNLVYSKEYFYKGEVKKAYYSLDLKTYNTKKVKKDFKFEKEEYHEGLTEKKYSPNKEYAIFVKDYNVFVETKKGVFQITKDGSKENTYAKMPYQRVFYNKYLKNNEVCSAVFSSDSKYVLFVNTKSENVKTLTVTQNFNKDSFEPFRPVTYEYEDHFIFENASFVSKLLVLELDTLKLKELDKSFDNMIVPEFSIMFDKENKGVYHMYENRSHNKKELFYSLLDDLSTKLCAYETTDTFFFDESMTGPVSPMFRGAYYLCNDEIIFWSNKEDNGAMYFIDKDTKTLGRRITDLSYYVTQILNVDEQNQKIYFVASKFSDFSEPYYNALCSIKFDGSGFCRLTNEDCMHNFVLSDDSKFFVDTYSNVYTAPKTVLRSTDLTINYDIVEADISKLLKNGYIMPKPFKVFNKEINDYLYGIIVLPDNYNPNKKYPVIDYVYGGMQIVNTPKSFSAFGDIEGRECFGGLEGFAKLGFIGVVIDGPGTPFRGKKFHDISYQHMGDCSGLFYHPSVIEELSKTYTGIDLTRVGIWGNSAGGYATVRALSLRPDFYKVGVSSAGDHDNQIYSASWAERFNGPYDKDIYKKQDSARIINGLEGKLLLVHGLLDDNVNPSQTFRLIEFLEKANKDYDFIVLPDTDHNVPANPYFLRRRFDYFVTHLMHEVSPSNFKFNHKYFDYEGTK